MEAPNGQFAVQTFGISRHFGKVKAVNEISLSIPQGGVYGILGPNGAGKTTLIRMLATLLNPTSGHARVFGHDIVAEKNAIRYLVSLTGQFASVDDDLTGYENLLLLARLLGYSQSRSKIRARELLEGFGLLEAAKRQVKTYSGGMRKRIDIAASIVVRPSLLFLDEPTTGLDPRSRTQVWDIIRAMVQAGTTVLLTTQYLDEADQLAGRIAVIDNGKVIAQGTPFELKSLVGSSVLRVKFPDKENFSKAVSLINNLLKLQSKTDLRTLELSAPVRDPVQASEILQTLNTEAILLTSFSIGQPSLDEVFLSLTGQPA